MKKIIFAALVLLTAVSCGQKPAVFTGKITGLKPGSNVMVMDIYNPDSATPVEVSPDGSYRFEIADGPCARHLIIDDPKGGFKFYAEPGMKATIDLALKQREGTDEETYESLVTYSGDNKDVFDFLSEGEFYSTVQNPVIMAHYDAKDLTFAQFEKELKANLDAQVAKLPKVQSPVFRKWMEADYYEKLRHGTYSWFPDLTKGADPDFKAWLESLDRNRDLKDAQAYMSGYSAFWLPEGKDRHEAYFEALGEQFTNKDFIRQLADSYVGNVLREAPANINEIFDAYKAVEPGRAVPEEIQAVYDHYKNLVPGALAADFDMYDIDGNKVMLSDLRGKALYIDCWATWCGPCRAETPNMVKLYNHYKNDPRIQLVSVSLDKKENNWKAVVAEEKLAWPQYIVHEEYDGALCKNYDITGIPRFLFFDRDGRILSLDAKRPSDPEIIDWIESLLK